ncbi:MAG: PepSY domain-containing protein, partial [Bacteroidota bacterium]
MKKQRAKTARKLHKWPGLILAFFLLFFSVSGIFLNHRQIISNTDIPRKWMPRSYHFDNWNLASIKGSLSTQQGKTYLYGNTGIWETDSLFTSFSDFSSGIPQTADRLKTYKMIEHKNKLWAATHYGLYTRVETDWQHVKLPVEEERIVDLHVIHSKLHVLTRSHIIRNTASGNWEVIELPAAAGQKKELSLFRTLWDIHSGEFLGLPGRLFVDLMGVIIFILSLTGILFFFNPRLRRWFKHYRNAPTRKITRWSLHYHNWLGKYTFIVIGLIALTGMFLRPPLLIPIAGTSVPVIPYTHYDRPNPWFDKLRAMLYDEDKDRVLFSTSEGMFYTDTDFKGPVKRFSSQPPVSVMGITVFDKLAAGDYLVGSFSGLYRWIPGKNYVMNMVLRQPATQGGGTGNPFGGTAVSGFVVDAQNHAYLFDYDKGAGSLGHNRKFGKMPEKLTSNGRISLWNASLEVHTARIYSALLGDFYILIVPLAGTVSIMVSISGYIIYRKRYRKNVKK